MLQRILFLLMLIGLIGCSGGTSSYSVSIKNDLPRPVTIALTKNGPPFEAAWASPEDVSARRVSPENANGIQIVEAGKTASVHNVAGRFDKSTQAVLRVYSGAATFREMLDTPVGPGRVDVVLSPGKNDLVVREGSQGLLVEPRP